MLKALVSVGVCLAVSGCSFFEGNIVAACEEALQQRLRSPSSYTRIELSQYKRTIKDRADYERLLSFMKDPAARARALGDFDSGTLQPTEFRLLIVYDAMNAFGVPIRGTAECKWENLHRDDDSKAAFYSVTVDGKTLVEWAQSEGG